MTLQNCKHDKFYKRPHWTDYFIQYNTSETNWVYDNNSPVGPIVRNIDDLIECDRKGNAIAAAPIKVAYESQEPYDLIVCEFPNSTKEYEYKIQKDTPLEENQPLVTEVAGKLGITTFLRKVRVTTYPVDKLAWIYGTINCTRDKNKSAATDIISSILNKGN